MQTVKNGHTYDKNFLNKKFAFIGLSYTLVLGFYLTKHLGVENRVALAFASSAFVFAFVHLWSVTYGILNDSLACRDSIEYFTNGHTPFHRRLVKT